MKGRKRMKAKNEIKSYFKGGKLWVLLSGLVCVVLGIVMIVNPAGVLQVACYLLGGVLVLFGIGEIVQVFVRPDGAVGVSRMIPGILAMAVGLAFIFQKDALLSILWFFIGITILIDAVYKLEHAFAMKNAGIPHWWISLLTAVLAMVLAVAVMIRPMEAETAMLVLSGAVLLVNGIFDLAEFVLLTLAAGRMRTVATVVIEDAQVTDLTERGK